MEDFIYDRSSLERVLVSLYNALSRHDHLRAWSYFSDELYVEVKGTSRADWRFYMTPNEREFTSTNGWRLAMVTDILGSPDATPFTRKQMEQLFSLQPMAWIGSKIAEDE